MSQPGPQRQHGGGEDNNVGFVQGTAAKRKIRYTQSNILRYALRSNDVAKSEVMDSQPIDQGNSSKRGNSHLEEKKHKELLQLVRANSRARSEVMESQPPDQGTALKGKLPINSQLKEKKCKACLKFVRPKSRARSEEMVSQPLDQDSPLKETLPINSHLEGKKRKEFLQLVRARARGRSEGLNSQPLDQHSALKENLQEKFTINSQLDQKRCKAFFELIKARSRVQVDVMKSQQLDQDSALKGNLPINSYLQQGRGALQLVYAKHPSDNVSQTKDEENSCANFGKENYPRHTRREWNEIKAASLVCPVLTRNPPEKDMRRALYDAHIYTHNLQRCNFETRLAEIGQQLIQMYISAEDSKRYFAECPLLSCLHCNFKTESRLVLSSHVDKKHKWLFFNANK